MGHHFLPKWGDFGQKFGPLDRSILWDFRWSKCLRYILRACGCHEKRNFAFRQLFFCLLKSRPGLLAQLDLWRHRFWPKSAEPKSVSQLGWKEPRTRFEEAKKVVGMPNFFFHVNNHLLKRILDISIIENLKVLTDLEAQTFGQNLPTLAKKSKNGAPFVDFWHMCQVCRLVVID